MEIKNYNGVIIEPRKLTDYFAGEFSGIKYEEVLKDGNWTDFLPEDERQHYKFLETYACVSFSFLNSIETQMNYFIVKGLLTLETMEFLNDSGYLVNGKFNASDRFLAKQSGTTNKGNSLIKVADTGRHGGILPEKDWSWKEDFNWDEYYAEIPQELKNKAMKFYDYFDIQYEWVSAGLPSNIEMIKKHLKQAPLQIASATCSGWSSGQPVDRCELPVSHATMIYNVDDFVRIFDTYQPFAKSLALNYFIPYILKINLIPNSNKMKIIGDKRDVKQYIVGKDNKLHWLFNETILNAFHDMGIVDKGAVEWKADLSGYVLGEPIALIK